MSEIKIEKLRKEYKDVIAVNDVSITFPAESVTCLLGPSGCGKTTLLRMIAGLEEPTSGKILFGGKDVTNLAPSERNIGMVFQYPVVYKGVTVYENIELPLLQDKLSETVRRDRVESVLDILGLKESAKKDISVLDNGTRQKVAVAREVARQPQIILFDEPITNVDVAAKDQLKEALKRLTRQLKQTIVYVTHDQTEAMTLADEIALMEKGVVVQRESPRNLYNKPNNVFGGWFLGNPGMNFVDVVIKEAGSQKVIDCPLFPSTLKLDARIDHKNVKLGIRPEYVRVTTEKNSRSVEMQVSRKAIVVGGQYLVTLKTGDIKLKAKIVPSIGKNLKDSAWVELPLDSIGIFDNTGSRLETRMNF